MTRPAIPTHIEYLGDGGDVTFTFPFPITASTELEVRVNGAVRTDDFHYDLEGVGSLTGGTVTFRTAPVANTVISLRLITAYEQLLNLLPNTPLPAVSLEGQLDQIVKMIQVLDEELSRRPLLAVGVEAALRHRVFPPPLPLKLWGWDATGKNISYYDPTILQVTPSLSVHITFGETVVDVPTVNGATRLEASGVFPAASIRIGAMVRVTTTFGNAGGLTTFSAGSLDVLELWGHQLARTSVAAPTGSNNAGVWDAFQLKSVASAESVFLTADSGTFSTTGAARVTGTWMAFTAA